MYLTKLLFKKILGFTILEELKKLDFDIQTS